MGNFTTDDTDCMHVDRGGLVVSDRVHNYPKLYYFD